MAYMSHGRADAKTLLEFMDSQHQRFLLISWFSQCWLKLEKNLQHFFEQKKSEKAKGLFSMGNVVPWCKVENLFHPWWKIFSTPGGKHAPQGSIFIC